MPVGAITPRPAWGPRSSRPPSCGGTNWRSGSRPEEGERDASPPTPTIGRARPGARVGVARARATAGARGAGARGVAAGWRGESPPPGTEAARRGAPDAASAGTASAPTAQGWSRSVRVPGESPRGMGWGFGGSLLALAPTGLHAVGHPPVDAGLDAAMRRDAGAVRAL